MKKISVSDNYIAKMFSLKKFLLVNVFLNWFVFVRIVGNQGCLSRKSIHWKVFEQIGIGKAYIRLF